MSDERSGPFYVRSHSPVPARNTQFERAGPSPTIFQNLNDAIRFVMEVLPARSRATAWIDAMVGPSIQIDEIEHRYNAMAPRARP